MALTKEQHNEILFLAIEQLQAQPSNASPNFDSILTSEQLTNLLHLMDQEDRSNRFGDPDSFAINTKVVSA